MLKNLCCAYAPRFVAVCQPQLLVTYRAPICCKRNYLGVRQTWTKLDAPEHKLLSATTSSPMMNETGLKKVGQGVCIKVSVFSELGLNAISFRTYTVIGPGLSG